ncbi:hypothetical protein VPHK453_0096 [Vibrio phage K453]
MLIYYETAKFNRPSKQSNTQLHIVFYRLAL